MDIIALLQLIVDGCMLILGLFGLKELHDQGDDIEDIANGEEHEA